MTIFYGIVCRGHRDVVFLACFLGVMKGNFYSFELGFRL